MINKIFDFYLTILIDSTHIIIIKKLTKKI